jgi:peptide deformylase
MVSILQKENKVLRYKALPVPVTQISSPKIQKIISDMKTALASQDDGVAIAAPQIGSSHRIFVVSGKIFDPEFGEENYTRKNLSRFDDLVFINPEFIKLSKKKTLLPEGCLSVRWLYGDVERSTQATVKAYNERGELFSRGASGLLAQIFQHEIDHLEGILFVDKAHNLEEVLPKKHPHESK